MRDDPSLTLVAGCTDLYVGFNAGSERSRRFLNLWNLDDLRGIERRDGMLSIGALATFTELMRSRAVRAHVP